MTDSKIALFEGKTIRKLIHQNVWWFSIIDVIIILTDSDRPRKYWNDHKKKLTDEGHIEVSEKIVQLKMEAPERGIILKTSESQKRLIGKKN